MDKPDAFDKLTAMFPRLTVANILYRLTPFVLILTFASTSCTNSADGVILTPDEARSSADENFPTPTEISTLDAPLVVVSSTPIQIGSTSTHTPIPEVTPSETPSPTIPPNPTVDSYAGLRIKELAARSYGGGELNIIDTLEVNDDFTRYLITYPSDGLNIYGYMNVPNEGFKFPVALVLHGYIDPSEYQIVTYTARYANNLARAGYLVIHPNFRNHPPSDSGPLPFRVDYAIDVLNLIAVIREQSSDSTGYLRRANADDISLWGHSMGGGIALRVITVNSDEYIRAAVLYGSMSGDEEKNYSRIDSWCQGTCADFELATPDETLLDISPLYHLDRINAAVSIHHSEDDEVVPPEWSEELCQNLLALNHDVECFTYSGVPHTFRGPADALFTQRIIDFFNRN
jgi:dienelactone hydrolase